MTSPPQPPPGEGKSALQFLRPLRDLAVYALVGAPALLLFVAVVRLIPDSGLGFGPRTRGSFDDFVNLATIFFPLAAVLLALLTGPRHPKAQLVVVAALVEYAVVAFFGVLFGFLIGLINLASDSGARAAFEELLVRGAWLGVFGVAAYAVFRVWQGMFHVPKPKPQPGVYGNPQYNQPGAFPGQPGYGPPPGQPGYPPHPGGQYPGAPQPGGYPPPPGAAPYGPPQTYGQPQPPSWNQPAVPIPASGAPAYPASAPPAPGYPTSAPPASGFPPPSPASAPPAPPAASSPFSEPTQVVPPTPAPPAPAAPAAPAPGEDRTEKIPDDRPGFGPADQDPPRH
ncbi:hypothetical protein ACFY36_44205 [Actinoplanes sp. NPDC000266]